jgi:6-pyruvoyltetrahydropterin/6-carboxytetrahydropterin synthase
MRGLGRYYEMDVVCQGEPDLTTGYLVNIKAVDVAVRRWALPAVERACLERPHVEPQDVIWEIATALSMDDEVGRILHGLTWWLTPTYAVEVDMTEQGIATIRQSFDFAAAHRLHVPELSEDENRSVFGACNNPSGHGHNYRFEPLVALRVGDGAPDFTLADLERLADEVILQRYDHTHLNVDTEEFDPARGGVNPSVEHIARVFFERLKPAIESHGEGVELRAVTVWETDRTCCTYPG